MSVGCGCKCSLHALSLLEYPIDPQIRREHHIRRARQCRYLRKEFQIQSEDKGLVDRKSPLPDTRNQAEPNTNRVVGVAREFPMERAIFKCRTDH